MLLAALLLTGTDTAWAAGVVGTNTAASCTDAALNAALAGGGSVTFHCGGGPVTIDISSGTGTKTVGTDTTVDGGGLITISGGNAVQVFNVNRSVNFTMQNLTVANSSRVGAIYNSAGTLTITNSTFSANSAGAIYNYTGTLTVTNSTFSGNGAGAIYNYAGMLTVTNSIFSGNSAGGGGAIYNYDGTQSVTNSTFSGNSAGSGGAIYNDAGTLTVTSSTFSSNSAGSGGGAIFSGGAIHNHVAMLTVTNSTFFGNSGGAVSNVDAKAFVTNSTFSGNSAGDSNGGCISNTGTALLRNTIVANSPSGDNCAGSITDGGHNLDDGTSCGFGTAKGSSVSGTDPQLDPAGLSNNGGPTQTVALCTGVSVPAGCTAASPAIDAGDQPTCAAPPVNNRDQRGLVRPGSGHMQCSIGAYEAGLIAPGACVGDCDGSGSVTVDEIITLANIALGHAELLACPLGAPTGAAVDVALIIQAVNNALSGCS